VEYSLNWFVILSMVSTHSMAISCNTNSQHTVPVLSEFDWVAFSVCLSACASLRLFKDELTIMNYQ